MRPAHLQLDHPSFRRAVTDVRTAAERLRSDRDRIGREVGSFLDGGWSGVAADAFTQGWADWTSASGDVLDGLDAMGALLDAVHHDLSTRDDDTRVRLDRVAARIVTRLG